MYRSDIAYDTLKVGSEAKPHDISDMCILYAKYVFHSMLNNKFQVLYYKKLPKFLQLWFDTGVAYDVQNEVNIYCENCELDEMSGM